MSLKADLHVHSLHSWDGVMRPRDIVALARRRGLGAIAITDHNTIRGGEEGKRYETQDLKVIVGAEMMTEMGEVTGLFLSAEIRARRFHDVVEEIRKQRGLVVVPHPFDALRRSAFPITDEYVGLVDAIEGFNSRCVLQRYNTRAVAFAVGHGLVVVGGSDAHYGNEVGLAGIVTRTDDVREAIEQNDLALFGRRSPLMNHVRTKILKQWRRPSG